MILAYFVAFVGLLLLLANLYAHWEILLATGMTFLATPLVVACVSVYIYIERTSKNSG